MTATLPYSVILEHVNNDNIWNIRQWCYNNFGPCWGVVEGEDTSRKGTWTVIWTVTKKFYGYRWYFRNEKDLLMFQLRWS